MKLLLDQGLPRSTVEFLADQGIVAEHVGDLGMGSAPDAMILDFARQRQMVVATLDADFHRLLAAKKAAAPLCHPDSHGRTKGTRASPDHRPGSLSSRDRPQLRSCRFRLPDPGTRSFIAHWPLESAALALLLLCNPVGSPLRAWHVAVKTVFLDLRA